MPRFDIMLWLLVKMKIYMKVILRTKKTNTNLMCKYWIFNHLANMVNNNMNIRLPVPNGTLLKIFRQLKRLKALSGCFWFIITPPAKKTEFTQKLYSLESTEFTTRKRKTKKNQNTYLIGKTL